MGEEKFYLLYHPDYGHVVMSNREPTEDDMVLPYSDWIDDYDIAARGGVIIAAEKNLDEVPTLTIL